MNNCGLKIGVLHIYSFPLGLAPTTRITAYCKGLLKQGAKVDIISIMPQTSPGAFPLFGTCDGGKYYHFCYPPKIKIPFIRTFFWLLKDAYCIYHALRFIVNSHKKEPYNCIILSFDSPLLFHIIVPVLSKLKGLLILAIADEYPIPIRKYLKSSIPTWKINLYKRIYTKIDGRILMTEKLKKFYDLEICSKPTLLLSTIVDTDRFNYLSPKKSQREYLCYMGNMELSKDNVDNIIKAFSLIKDKYLNLDLHLYGAPNNGDKNKLISLIAELELSDRVFIKGRVNYSEVPGILAGAKILVTSQPDTKRAEGGFPTKLGEYFMSNVPTVLTDVGEISNYVRDKFNAYLVPPLCPELYADTLQYVLDNYADSLVVAKNAKEYILNNFSCDIAGKSIADFIIDFKRNYN